MNILVTNDDGILAPGLWSLVSELQKTGHITVAAPDREQSAQGTAVTLRHPLRVQKVKPLLSGVDTYAIEGTPSDSVILAMSKLIPGRIDLVVSGVNSGPNLGDDVLISGTVGAALQGYLRGATAIAVSVDSFDSLYLDNAARLAALITGKIADNTLPGHLFLNVNLPDLPLINTGRIRITRLASRSHIETVKEGHDGKKAYYWLIRQKIERDAVKDTDIHAIEQGDISITPLHSELLNKPLPDISDNICAELIASLKGYPESPL